MLRDIKIWLVRLQPRNRQSPSQHTCPTTMNGQGLANAENQTIGIHGPYRKTSTLIKKHKHTTRMIGCLCHTMLLHPGPLSEWTCGYGCRQRKRERERERDRERKIERWAKCSESISGYTKNSHGNSNAIDPQNNNFYCG